MFSKIYSKYVSQKNLYFSILFLIMAIFLWKNTDIGILIFVSVIFATALNPLVDKLEKKMKRPLATTLVLFGFLIVVGMVILPMLYLSVYEIVEFAKEFPKYINYFDNLVKEIPFLQYFNINTASITNTLTNSSINIFKDILDFASEAGEALLYIFTSFVLLFFFLVDKIQIKKAILKIFPIEYREKTDKMLVTLCDKLSGYILAQTLVSGSVLVTMTIGLLIFKINYAVLLGVIAGIFSIIPIVGSALSLVICLIATCEMGIKYLIIVTVLYCLSHFIENNIVRPYVYSKFLNLHQIIIFLALIIGAKYQGIFGMILAPPFAMALYILLDELYIKKMDEYKEPIQINTENKNIS